MTGIVLPPKQSTSWVAVTQGTRHTATQLLSGLRTGACGAQSITTALQPPLPLPGASASVYNTGKFFYYSNDPENVSTGLADNSLMLLGPTPGFPAQVSGSGRVFLWHANDMNQAVNTGLYIYNPDPNNTGATITVEATYGFVPGQRSKWGRCLVRILRRPIFVVSTGTSEKIQSRPRTLPTANTKDRIFADALRCCCRPDYHGW
jgi:hypothetical protein